MQQPSIVEFVAPQAREQGAQEATQKRILEVLTLRLQLMQRKPSSQHLRRLTICNALSSCSVLQCRWKLLMNSRKR